MPRARRTGPHLWKHASGVRYIVWQEDGKTRMRSTGTKMVAAAEAELRAFREDWERRKWGRQEEAPIGRAVDEWMAEKAKPRWGLAASTLNQYRYRSCCVSRMRQGFVLRDSGLNPCVASQPSTWPPGPLVSRHDCLTTLTGPRST